MKSVNNSIRNAIGRSFSFDVSKRQEKRCYSKDWNKRNAKKSNFLVDVDAGIDVTPSASVSDKVNDTSILDLNFSFNIQEYFDSNPILAKNYDLIFNQEFQKLY